MDAESVADELHDAQHVHVDGVLGVVGTRTVELATAECRLVGVQDRRSFALDHGVVITKEPVGVRFLQVKVRARIDKNIIIITSWQSRTV